MTTETDKIATTLRRQLELVPLGERGITPTNIDELFRLAQAISISQICPPGFSETDCFVIIATGLEIGLAPFTAIQNMYIVNHRANVFGDIALALIRASGLLEDYKQEYFGTPFEDSYGCRVTSKRKGMSEALVHQYTVADAKIAKKWNLYHTGRNGEKTASPWVTDPNRMLLFRARSFNLRDNFGDILKGCGVDTEDEETIAGFEHAKAAQGKIVEPNFDTGPKGIRRLGVPPVADTEQISDAKESPKESAGNGKPAGSMAQAPPIEPVKRGRPRKSEKSDLFDPPKAATPPPEPTPPAGTGPALSKSAQEVLRRLQADDLKLSNFIYLMQRNQYMEGEGNDLASVTEDGLDQALAQWSEVVHHLRETKDEEERPFA